MNIAVVDDDRELAALMCLWLEQAGHVCRAFHDAESFRRAIDAQAFDIVLLDWVMPGLDGEQLLNWLRRQPVGNLGVIFVTARNTEDDMVRILNEGADDYLVKPITQRTLLARVGAVARRLPGRLDDGRLTVGPYTIDIRGRRILREDAPVRLTDKEFDLAHFLFRNLGRLLTREQILASVWGYEADVNTRTLDTHISRIRKKLQLVPENGWRLASVYHQGYRLEQLAKSGRASD